MAAQGLALLVIAARLAPGRTRRPPERPRPDDRDFGDDDALTIVIATLNEAARLGPCLDAVCAQGAPVREILVVDSNSTDGTRALVQAAAQRDPRVRLLTDPPLPSGWKGKAWALQHGTEQARTPWVLGMDADTVAAPGLAAAVVRAARREAFDVVSFSPSFDGMTVAEQWVQPAILLTLVYRTGAAGDPTVTPDRAVANGQCFLARRQTVLGAGGYEPVKASWAEDVALVRHLARRGVRVGFLDGSRLYRVFAYTGLPQMWREWGRSIALRDATGARRQELDLALLLVAQASPLWVALALALRWDTVGGAPWRTALAATTGALLGIRLLMLLALRGSYARPGVGFWLSPLADLAAVARIALSMARPAKTWRTREYGEG